MSNTKPKQIKKVGGSWYVLLPKKMQKVIVNQTNWKGWVSLEQDEATGHITLTPLGEPRRRGYRVEPLPGEASD